MKRLPDYDEGILVVLAWAMMAALFFFSGCHEPDRVWPSLYVNGEWRGNVQAVRRCGDRIEYQPRGHWPDVWSDLPNGCWEIITPREDRP